MRLGLRFRRRCREQPPAAPDGSALAELRVCEHIARLYGQTGTVWVPFGYDVRPGPSGAISIRCPSELTFDCLRGWPR